MYIFLNFLSVCIAITILQIQNQQNSEKTIAANIDGAPQILKCPLIQYDLIWVHIK